MKRLNLMVCSLLLILLATPVMGSKLDEVRLEAEQGKVKSQLILGYLYFEGKGGVSQNKKEAAKWIGKAAEQGDAEAQFLLGVMYSGGMGVPQDYREAEKWTRKAAGQGNSSAQNYLGEFYHSGKGAVQKDYKESAKWFRAAAEQGNASAQFNLSRQYCLGEGMPIDLEEAYSWLILANANGHKNSAKIMKMMQDDLTPAQLEKAQQIAKTRWKP